jgi:hypothetical protein
MISANHSKAAAFALMIRYMVNIFFAEGVSFSVQSSTDAVET